MLFSIPGTLAGVAQTIQFGSGQGPARYLEVHNLSNVNQISCLVANATIPIPPLRKLVVTDAISQVVLNGTGDYLVIANSDPQERAAGPSIQPTFYGVGGSSTTSPADGVTIEDTGTAIRVKDLGISTGKLIDLAVKTAKIDDAAVTGSKLAPGSVGTINLGSQVVTYPKAGVGVVSDAGQVPSLFYALAGVWIGTTLTLTYGGTPVTYVFGFVDPGVPGQVWVDLAALPGSLTAAIMANQPDLVATGNATFVVIGAPTAGNIWPGVALTGVASAGTLEQIVTAAGSALSGATHYRIVLTALQAANGFAVWAGYPIRGYQLTGTRAAGAAIFSLAGGSAFLTGANKGLVVVPLGAGAVVGDIVDVTLFH